MTIHALPTTGFRPIVRTRSPLEKAKHDARLWLDDLSEADERVLNKMADYLVEVAGKLCAMTEDLSTKLTTLDVFDTAEVIAEGRLDDALDCAACGHLKALIRLHAAKFAAVNAGQQVAS